MMNLITQEAAFERLCPMREQKCIASDCMAWRFEGFVKDDVYPFAAKIHFNGKVDLDVLKLSNRALNVIGQVASTVGQLCTCKPNELRRARGCGKDTYQEIVAELERVGLRLGMSRDETIEHIRIATGYCGLAGIPPEITGDTQ